MKRYSLFLYINLIFFTFLFISSCGGSNHQSENQVDENGRELEFIAEVSFVKNEADTISSIEVAVADDNQSRSEGLMNVTELPSDSGMLFIFTNNQPRSFWMANTPLPLDIMFVNSELEIVRIHRNTQPYSQESIQSEVPARFVVEVNAGYTLEHDIREGMKIAIEGVDF
ncbi:MAG: DUF192 domain-containing protein [Balneolaceae bacterium]|nr:DUF192 domain-containing protein [Balneolaceae bacterium]MDR9410495.1 DUF192 domain-containing protein [Balneolaceae bacterium]